MRTKLLCAIASLLTCVGMLNAQTNTFPITGNAGINTLSPATPLQVIGSSRFGSATNYTQVDDNGNLTLNGSANYKVSGNRYAFQFASKPNYGLFFNSTDRYYEFRNSLASPVFYVGADSGQGFFAAGVSVGSLKTPPNNGLYVSGRVGIGTVNPVVPLHVDGGGALSLKGGGFIVAGSLSAFNLGISNGAIQARNNGAGSLLTINKEGGDIFFGGSVGIGGTPSAKLHVMLGTESTLSGGGYIVAGFTALNNIVIDDAGIQARNNGQAQVLNLNPHGGTIYTPGTLQTGGLIINEDMIDFGVGRGPGFRSDLSNNAIKIAGNFRPNDDDLWNLGSSFKRWTEVWSVDGSINTSDERDKKNIRALNYGLKEIMQLKPVRFNWKNNVDDNDKLGLIAQDLQKVLPEVVKDHEYVRIDSTKKLQKIASAKLGVMYADIIPVLISAMQEQQKEIEELKDLIRQTSQAGNKSNQKNTTSVTLSDASLEQNAPNPFYQTTTINYYVPQNAGNAFIKITDMIGKIIKIIPISVKDNGQIIVQAAALTVGTYQYSLVVNGRLIDTKKMVLTK